MAVSLHTNASVCCSRYLNLGPSSVSVIRFTGTVCMYIDRTSSIQIMSISKAMKVFFLFWSNFVIKQHFTYEALFKNDTVFLWPLNIFLYKKFKGCRSPMCCLTYEFPGWFCRLFIFLGVRGASSKTIKTGLNCWQELLNKLNIKRVEED